MPRTLVYVAAAIAGARRMMRPRGGGGCCCGMMRDAHQAGWARDAGGREGRRGVVGAGGALGAVERAATCVQRVSETAKRYVERYVRRLSGRNGRECHAGPESNSRCPCAE